MLKEAEEILAESDYTLKHIKYLAKLMKKRERTSWQPITQQQVDEAIAKLETARKNLVVKKAGKRQKMVKHLRKRKESSWLKAILGNLVLLFTKNGIMVTGWLFTGNTWYYLNDSGAMETGWVLQRNMVLYE